MVNAATDNVVVVLRFGVTFAVARIFLVEGALLYFVVVVVAMVLDFERTEVPKVSSTPIRR